MGHPHIPVPPHHMARRLRQHHPTLQHPTPLHLTPHRRGCPRRALFRVFAHPKVFALLLSKNASYDILRPPRGILAISPCRRDESWVGKGAATSSFIPTPPTDTLHQPISPHIDEDALEGLYFAFSLILRCLPYFCRKTRPRGSYELLEAFLPSCGECGASFNSNTRIWEPGILKVGLSITPEPAIRIRVVDALGARFAVPSR